MTQNETIAALVAVAFLAYSIGAQAAAKRTAASFEKMQADPFAWLSGWQV